jgi:hypothetical protein
LDNGSHYCYQDLPTLAEAVLLLICSKTPCVADLHEHHDRSVTGVAPAFESNDVEEVCRVLVLHVNTQQCDAHKP